MIDDAVGRCLPMLGEAFPGRARLDLSLYAACVYPSAGSRDRPLQRVFVRVRLLVLPLLSRSAWRCLVQALLWIRLFMTGQI